MRGGVLREQPVPRRAALVQLEVLEDVGAQHLRQAADYLMEELKWECYALYELYSLGRQVE